MGGLVQASSTGSSLKSMKQVSQCAMNLPRTSRMRSASDHKPTHSSQDFRISTRPSSVLTTAPYSGSVYYNHPHFKQSLRRTKKTTNTFSQPKINTSFGKVVSSTSFVGARPRTVGRTEILKRRQVT